VRFTEALYVIQSTLANLPHSNLLPTTRDRGRNTWGSPFCVYTHTFTFVFGETGVHVCKSNIKH